MNDYAKQWGKWYKRDDVKVKEWHCSYEKASLIVDPYVEAALNSERGGTTVVDVGCGLSSMGFELIQAKRSRLPDVTLFLLDIAKAPIEELRTAHADNPSINCVEEDCRNMVSVRDATASIVIDKGTLDALCGDEDKVAMLRDCKRILRPDGIIISISFASPARLSFLTTAALPLGLSWRPHILLCDGRDPARGGTALLVTLLSLAPDFAGLPYLPDDTTRELLGRIERTGGLCDAEEPSPDVPQLDWTAT